MFFELVPILWTRAKFNLSFQWRKNRIVAIVSIEGKKSKDDVVIVLNMTPVVRTDWKLYLDGKEKWTEIFNSDDKKYWGTGNTFNPDIPCTLVDKKEKRYELILHLPPLAAVILK